MNRLLDQILHENYRVQLPPNPPALAGIPRIGSPNWTTEKLRYLIRYYSRRAIAVDIQNVLEWCVDNVNESDFDNTKGISKLTVERLLSQIPSRLPFDPLWLEGTLLQGALWEKEDQGKTIQLGMLLLEFEPYDMPDVLGISTFHFIRTETRTPMLIGGFSFRSLPKGQVMADIVSMPINQEAGDDWYDGLLWNAGWYTANTLVCFSCKNVPFVKTESRIKASRKSLRKGGPPLPDFHIVDIHRHFNKHLGMSALRDAERSLSHAHIQRGHFKQYTEEAPLMGKHVGRWFWEPQIRGTGKVDPAIYRVWGPSPEHLPDCKLKRP